MDSNFIKSATTNFIRHFIIGRELDICLLICDTRTI